MAGRGPAPKAPGRRARRNKEEHQVTRIRWERAPQPDLPEEHPTLGEWPEQTRQWWRMWGESPLSDTFGATDWAFLLDTALLHASVWSGSQAVMAELRLRVAKFGATPEDRARLRIQFAEADERDPQPRVAAARERYGSVTRLPTASDT